MPEITILGPTEAEGIWAMFDYVLKPGQPTGIKGYGHYHETYRKCEDGQWRISSKRNERLQSRSGTEHVVNRPEKTATGRRHE